MRSDPTGKDHWVERGSVPRINVPVQFRGDGATPAKIAEYKAHVANLSGKYDGYINGNSVSRTVTFRVQTEGVTPGWNQVVIRKGYGDEKSPWGKGFGAEWGRHSEMMSLGGERKDWGAWPKWDFKYGVQHTTGHHVGLGDTHNTHTGELKPGADPNNIMSGRPEGKFDIKDILKIIKSGGIGFDPTTGGWSLGGQNFLSMRALDWGPMAYSPAQGAEATNGGRVLGHPPDMMFETPQGDFAWGNRDPEADYPTGPRYSAWYGNHSW